MINLPSNLIAIIANVRDTGQASAVNVMETNVKTVGRLVIKQRTVGAKRRRKGRKRRKTETTQRKIQRSP